MSSEAKLEWEWVVSPSHGWARPSETNRGPGMRVWEHHQSQHHQSQTIWASFCFFTHPASRGGFVACLRLSGGRSAISPLFSMRLLGIYEVGLGQPPASWFIQLLLSCYLLLWGASFVGRWPGLRKGFIPGLCLFLSRKLWSIIYRMALPLAF